MTVLGRIVKKDKKSEFLEILCLKNIIFFFFFFFAFVQKK